MDNLPIVVNDCNSLYPNTHIYWNIEKEEEDMDISIPEVKNEEEKKEPRIVVLSP